LTKTSSSPSPHKHAQHQGGGGGGRSTWDTEENDDNDDFCYAEYDALKGRATGLMRLNGRLMIRRNSPKFIARGRQSFVRMPFYSDDGNSNQDGNLESIDENEEDGGW
jgi:hypothetical protein